MKSPGLLLASAAFVVCLAPGPVLAQDEALFDCVMDPSVVVNLASPVGGIVEEISVDRGMTVTKGQEVARLNTRIEEVNLRVLERKAANSAAVDAQTARLAFLEAKLERSRALANGGVVTKAAIEEMEAEVEVTRDLLAEAMAAREIAQQDLERAQVALDLLHLRSPIDGLVIARSRSAGEYMTPESSLVTIVGIDPLFVEVFLPVDMFGQIAVGDVAEVIPAAPLSGSHEARVSVIDRVFDAASGTFGVRLVLENPGALLPAGHRCQVRFTHAP